MKGFRWIISCPQQLCAIWAPSLPLSRWGSWGTEVLSDMAWTGSRQNLRLKHRFVWLQPPWATMVYLDEHKIQGRKIPSPGSPEAEQPCPCPWAPGDYSIVCKEEEGCARCIINSDVLLTCNLFIYMAEAFSNPSPASISGDSESSLPFLFASLASSPYQQAPQEDLGSCCRVVLGNVFEFPVT